MKILVRLPNWLGDVVMSTAFIGAVRRLYPDAWVDVIIKQELKNIASLIPGINAIHPFSKKDFKGLKGVYHFGKQLKQTEQYDLFFNLPSSLSSQVLAWASGTKKRIGFSSEGSFLFLTNCYKKPVNLHRADEYIFLLEQFTGKVITDRAVKLNVIDASKSFKNRVIINFNSEAESRRMPADKGKSIINSLTNTFKSTTFSFIGSPKEADLATQIIADAENKDRIENLAGKTNLVELASLMAVSAAVLTTDSGPAHLANSTGVPVVVLFGAGNELNTAPYNKQNLTVIRYGRLPCEPCVKNTCELYGVPKCMQLIDELQIINTLRVYLPHA